MSIKIGFSTSTSWISRAIRWFTKSPVSHAFALIEAVPGFGDMVLQAIATGWTLTTRKRFEAGAQIVKLVSPTVPLDKGFDVALSWLDEPYAFAGVAGMAWVCLGRALRRVWRNPWPDPHHMFCSEGIVYMLQADGYPGADKLDPPSVSPADLLAFLGGA